MRVRGLFLCALPTWSGGVPVLWTWDGMSLFRGAMNAFALHGKIPRQKEQARRLAAFITFASVARRGQPPLRDEDA